MSVGPVNPSTNEILKDQVYLGNFSAAECQEHRKKLGITHVVSVCHQCPSPGGSAATHLHIAVEDTEYEDLLIHLPKTSRFIQEALEEGGRVLVHCVMGVSRSTTVVAAFLMKHRKMDARSALRYIKQRRPQVHPNYGFIKQLDTYVKCQFEPCSSNPVYRSWKKRQEQDVTNFLNQLVDTVSIIPNKLLLNSDFPEDPRQAESLLADLGITHVLSISPAELPPSALSSILQSKGHYYHTDIRNNAKEDLLLALPGAVQFVEKATSDDGRILVHSLMEVRACTVACACLMKQQNLAPDEAFSVIEDVLPLFNPTVNFSRNLELYDACGYQPTKNHAVVQEWLSSNGPESGFNKLQAIDLSPSPLRRPSGGIPYSSPPLRSSASPPKYAKTLSSTQQNLTLSSRTPAHCPVAPSLPSPSLPMRRKDPHSSSSGPVSGSSRTDLEARARDLLSETGLDLSGFTDALKEIEKSQGNGIHRGGVNGSHRGGPGTQKKQQAAPSLYC
ncbi:DSPc-domain-containing protein [Macrolepiota fuliginosa MF-IS2]|uniref:protein-tyrosine-phosphatase n=1 Tax=Macrolepiota fuliginosa MF-IS2 TaxID=1400762 RepID=A0A9P5XCW7_9AGAR|nr:DSPc-domain-containing protein [Macrolepiota fuliginosa MF-IS2]